MNFCDKCGICCKLFHELILPEEYRELDNGFGQCKYLHENLCSIYENRPPLCNSSWVYEHFFSDTYSWNEYITLITQQCTALKEKYGVNKNHGN